MKEQIDKILGEIFLIDPELKKHEKELKKIMQEIIDKKPDTKFDAAFKEELKARILARAEELIREKSAKKRWLKEFFTPRSLSYAFSGAITAFIIMLPVFYSFNKGLLLENIFGGNTVDIQKNVNKITNTGPRAFGDLALGAPGNEVSELAAQKESSIAGKGGGGGLEAPESSARIGIPYQPEIVEFNYLYEGEDFNLNESFLPVYKRIKEQSSSGMKDLFSELDLETIDLSKFKNIKINNLSLTEDREYGYYVNVNFENKSISISKNWNKWPSAGQTCQTEDCLLNNRLTIDDIPDDESIINVARGFLAYLGISPDKYGEPTVNDHWREIYENAENREKAWIPDEISVIFPFVVKGQTVYDYGGNKSGLSVNVDIREMKASGAYNIFPQVLESSDYPAETDVSRIMASLEKGGYQNYSGIRRGREADKVIEVELGAPSIELIMHYQYDPEKRTSDELYIPALVFPVKSLSEKTPYFNRQAIVVPLIKDILDADLDRGAIEPMPLLRQGIETEEAPAGKEAGDNE